MRCRGLGLLLGVVALFVFAAMPVRADDKAANDKANTHEGKIVSVQGTKLTMTGRNGKNEHTHTLADDAKVTCDGKACKLQALKPGMKVRVTTQKDDKTLAIKIEALDKNNDFGTKDQ